MSCCLILQCKNDIFIGADTATSVHIGDKFFRKDNKGEKIFEVGNDIVYCSGNMSYVPDVIKNVKLRHGYVDLEHISRYLKGKTFYKEPGFGFPSIGMMICRIIDGVSYVYELLERNNFDVVTRTLNQDGIQVWVCGIYNERCLQVAEAEIGKSGGEVISTYVNTYKKMACQEIGGNLNVYHINSNGYRKIIDNYDLKDGYAKTFYGIVADAVVGNLICGNNMNIGNEKGSVQITGDGIKITNGTIAWGNGDNSVNAPEMGDIDGLEDSLSEINTNITNFQTDVKSVLGLGTTTITSNSVIAPKIGGGYMFITDGRTTNNTGISVEINPNGTNFDGHNGNYIFNISKKEDNDNTKVIMGVKNNGDGYFSGEIQTESGKIGGWEITKNTIQSNYLTLKSDDNSRTFRLHSDHSDLLISPYGISHGFLDDEDLSGHPTLDIRISKDDNRKKFSYIRGGMYSSYMLLGQANNGFHDYFIKLDFDGDSTHIDSDLFVNGYIEASGLTEVSDERVKNSFKDLNEFDDIFMELKPIAFKYNEENEKQHFGYGANQVKQIFLNNGYSLNDFSGIVKLNPTDANSIYKNIADPMGLKYSEFIPWNTHMIQKLYKIIEKQQEERLKMRSRGYPLP